MTFLTSVRNGFETFTKGPDMKHLNHVNHVFEQEQQESFEETISNAIFAKEVFQYTRTLCLKVLNSSAQS